MSESRVLLGGGGVQSKHRWVSDTEQGPPMFPAATLAPGWLHSLLCQMRAELFKYLSSRIQISNISKIIVHIFAIFLALTLIEKNITHYYWLNISLMTDFMLYSKRGGMKSKVLSCLYLRSISLQHILLSRMFWPNFITLCDLRVLYSRVTVIGIVIWVPSLNTPCYNVISCPVLRVAFVLKFCQEHHLYKHWGLIKHSPKKPFRGCISPSFHL